METEYDPTIGQFISLDPDPDASDPQSLNGYTYADENPVVHSDPTGDRVDDTIPGLNAFVSARPGDTKTQHYALLSIRRYFATAREREYVRERNHAITILQERVAAAHAAVEQARRRAAEVAAQRASARRHSIFNLALLNLAAGAADLAAAAVEVVPGLDIAADAGAGYLDKEAAAADIAEFAGTTRRPQRSRPPPPPTSPHRRTPRRAKTASRAARWS